MYFEEKFSFSSGGIRLAGILGYPESDRPKRAVLLCGPHPNFSGNMENNVVCALFESFAKDSLILKFDYRGIGESEIVLPPDVSKYDYWEELEEQKKYREIETDIGSALSALHSIDPQLSLSVIGYSFGAITGLKAGMTCQIPIAMLAGIAPPLTKFSFNFLNACKVPCLLLSGSNDFVYCAGPESGTHGLPSNVRTLILTDEDHFFRGREQIVVQHLHDFLKSTSRNEP